MPPTTSRRCVEKARRFREHWLSFRANRKSKLHYFEKLLEGMSAQDLSFVANLEEMTASIRMYDAVNKRLVVVDDYLPWPVKFVMIRYHHKHMFENNRPPSRKNFMRDVCALENKFKWRAAMQGVAEGHGTTWARHKMYDVTPYRGTVEPTLRGFLQELRSKLLSAYCRVRRKHALGNKNAAFRWATQWLAEAGLTLSPFDKESGCCLVWKKMT